MNEVLATQLKLVILQPVATDRKNRAGALLNRHDIRQGNTGRIAVLVRILVALKIQIHMHLKDLIAVIDRRGEALLGGLLLLNLVQNANRLTKINVSVEASMLQFTQVVLGLTHAVRNTLSGLKALGTVWDYDVLSRNKHRRLALKRRVIIDFLERITRKTQAEEHTLVFGTVLTHDLRKLEIHVISNAD